MAQRHYEQHGTFHITTNAKGRIPWCTLPGVPEIVIDNLVMTKNLYRAEVFAFCILPDHVHIVMRPGEKGVSAFMHSFKRNSSRDVHALIGARHRSWGSRTPATVTDGEHHLRVVHEPHLRNGRDSTFHCDQIRWQNGFHDEHIRDATQRSAALTYVQYNAWRHGLCADPEGWPWSSLRYAHLMDPLEIWFD